MSRLRFLFLVLIFYSSISRAEKLVINPAHSSLQFNVDYMSAVSVIGYFSIFQGTVEMQSEEVRSLIVKIDISSIDTNNNLRDGHLKGADFFEIKKYPYIIFESSTIKALSDSHLEIRGYLKIKDKQKEILIKTNWSKVTQDPWGHKQRYVDFNFEIDRSSFGLNWNRDLIGEGSLIGQKIRIKGIFQLQPQTEQTANSKHFLPDLNHQSYSKNSTPAIDVGDKIVIKSSENNQKIPTQQALIEVERAHQNHSIMWELSYLIVGLLGFCSSVVLAIFGKSKVMNLLGLNVDESTVASLIADAAAVFIICIYAFAMWNLRY